MRCHLSSMTTVVVPLVTIFYCRYLIILVNVINYNNVYKNDVKFERNDFLFIAQETADCVIVVMKFTSIV